MSVVPVAERMTAAKFLELGVPKRGRPQNLVDGEVIVHEPSRLHGEVLEELQFELASWVRAEPCRGKVAVPLDVQLDEHNVFAPDLLWYAEGRVPARTDPPPYPMPDIAVEVRSPATWRHDIGEKKAGYERHGLPELWLVDTAAEVVIMFRRSAVGGPTFDVALELGAGQKLTSPLLPGFGPPVESLFSP